MWIQLAKFISVQVRFIGKPHGAISTAMLFFDAGVQPSNEDLDNWLMVFVISCYTPEKTNTFEDASPMNKCDFSLPC